MKTNIKTGLTSNEVIQNRKLYGTNALTNKSKNTIFKLFLDSLNDPIIKILLIALGIKLVFLFNDSNVFETLGIAISVFLASFISVLSEYSSEKAFEKLNNENSIIKVKVLRDSKKQVINIDEIVKGDIVFLESGDKVPADGIILEGEVHIDESSLTGESFEKIKNLNDKFLFMGSIVTEKRATMQVTEIGDKTYYGNIASEIQNNNIPSPLKNKLSTLAKYISRFGYIGAILVFLSYMINVFIDYDINNILTIEIIPHLLYALTLSVAVLVMAVPEGLPMMITLVLSSNMKRLLRKKVLVKKLVGIETSGSLNILFTDKTGTLTEGKMKVSSFMDAELKEYQQFINIKNNYEIIYQSLIYNNESFIDKNIVSGGNTTDRAILEFCNTDDKTKYKIINKKDFNSKNKYSSVTTNYNIKTTFIKGAYEVIINKCNKYLSKNGEKRVLVDKNKIIEKINTKTIIGERVIALALEENNSYTLVGFIFIKDNIRKEAYEGINLIKKAGIDVVMITGDSKETAYSVAKQLNIIGNSTDIILTSEELNNLSDEEVKKILPKLKVICRSLPKDKNRLVKLSQEKDLVVGMTGDGVNDAPALKRADVGFSMGTGCEVAKEVSEIVILDNNIKSISTAILYGRTIFKSIRKFVTFQLTVNICSVLLSIIGPFIGILSPITVIQVLWVNMVMDTFAGLAFSFEPALKEYMEEKPNKKNVKIINSYMKNQIFVNGIYSTMLCIWFLKSNLIKNIYVNEAYLMTAFFGLFIFIDIFNAFASRTHRINTFSNFSKNKVFLYIFIFITIVQTLLIYYGGELFRTTGLTIYEFEVMLLIAFSIIPFDIIRKIILKKRKVERGF